MTSSIILSIILWLSLASLLGCGAVESGDSQVESQRQLDSSGASAYEAGLSLYGRLCTNCHGPVETSTKRSKENILVLSARIMGALTSEPAMSRISLSSDQVKFIATALVDSDENQEPDESLAHLKGIRQGLQHYENHCLSCHQNIDVTTIKGKSYSSIVAASQNIPAMNITKEIPLAHIKLITKALEASPEERDQANSLPPPPEKLSKGADSGGGGVELYDRQCAQCHNTLTVSTKQGKGVASISAAIAGIQAMKFLEYLTPEQIELIAGALKVDGPYRIAIQNAPYIKSQKLADFNYMAKKLSYMRGLKNDLVYHTVKDTYGGRCDNINLAWGSCDPESQGESKYFGQVNLGRFNPSNRSFSQSAQSAWNNWGNLFTRADIYNHATTKEKIIALHRVLIDYQLPTEEEVSRLETLYNEVSGDVESRLLHVARALTQSIRFTQTSPFTAPRDNLAIFAKCYQDLTLSYLLPDHPMVASVVDGSKDAITACLDILSTAMLNESGDTIEATRDAHAILRNFQSFHSSIFFEQTGRNIEIRDRQGVMSNIASHFSLSLFGNTPVTDIYTRPDQALLVKDDDGWIIGFKQGKKPEVLRNWALGGSFDEKSKLRNDGGGFLTELGYYNLYHATGSVELTTDGLIPNSDGGNNMKRRVGQGYFNDVLCRELPVVRSEDAELFVEGDADSQFRPNAECVRCHVSMDQLASGFRNISGKYFSSWRYYLTSHTPNQELRDYWPKDSDASFGDRPAWGRIYYRDYQGKIVDRTFTGLKELGEVSATLDDTYICHAKRYFHMFTGFDIDISDPGGKTFTEQEWNYRNEIIALGLKLKQTQSLRTLVEDILKSQPYKEAR